MSPSATWNGTAAKPSTVSAMPDVIAPSGRTSSGHHAVSAAGVSRTAGAYPQTSRTATAAIATRTTTGTADMPATPASCAIQIAASAAALSAATHGAQAGTRAARARGSAAPAVLTPPGASV